MIRAVGEPNSDSPTARRPGARAVRLAQRDHPWIAGVVRPAPSCRRIGATPTRRRSGTSSTPRSSGSAARFRAAEEVCTRAVRKRSLFIRPLPCPALGCTVCLPHPQAKDHPMPGLTVTEKEHWRDRVARRIDKRIERIAAAEPNLMDRVKRDALPQAVRGHSGVSRRPGSPAFHLPPRPRMRNVRFSEGALRNMAGVTAALVGCCSQTGSQEEATQWSVTDDREPADPSCAGNRREPSFRGKVSWTARWRRAGDRCSLR